MTHGVLIKTEGGSLLALHQKNCDSAPWEMSIAFARGFASQSDTDPMTLWIEFLHKQVKVQLSAHSKESINWKYANFKSAQSIFLSYKPHISLLLGLKLELKDALFSTGDKAKKKRNFSFVP